METVNETLPPTDPPPPPQPPRPPLTRSTDDKVVSGLSGGLGRYFGIDPVVFRIAFVVMALAGGSGILLYLVGWLLIPDDRGAGAFHRVGNERRQKLLAAVVAGLGVLLLLDELTNGGDGDVPIGVVLVGLGALVLWSRRKQEGGGPPVPSSAPAPSTTPPTGDAATPGIDTERHQFDVGTAETVAGPASVPEPKPPRSALVAVTLSSLAILAGALTLFGVAAGTGLALALLLTGAALVLGAWRGRARWLIPVGLVLATGLAAVSLIDVPIRGGTGEVRYRPVTTEEVRSPYRLAAGDMVLDLGDLDLRGDALTVVASVAAGSLRVVVPAGVAVEIDAHVGAGDIDVLGRVSEGVDVERRVVETGAEGSGRLVLRTRAGVGMVEVRRAAA